MKRLQAGLITTDPAGPTELLPAAMITEVAIMTAVTATVMTVMAEALPAVIGGQVDLITQSSPLGPDA